MKRLRCGACDRVLTRGKFPTLRARERFHFYVECPRGYDT